MDGSAPPEKPEADRAKAPDTNQRQPAAPKEESRLAGAVFLTQVEGASKIKASAGVAKR